MTSTVEDLMTTDVPALSAETGFKSVVLALLDSGLGALAVTDPAGRVIGVVSERDLLRKEEFADPDGTEAHWRPPLRARLRERLGSGGGAADALGKARGVRARDLMSFPVRSVHPRTSAVTAARLIEQHGVRQLLVLDRGRLVGSVSRRDLLRVFARGDADILGEALGEAALAARATEGRPVSLRVSDGVVTATGSFRSRGEADDLVLRLSRIEGVIAVDDALEWQVDDSAAPAPRHG